MAKRTPETVEIGIHILGENQNSGVMVLFGGATPGGLGDYDDIAELGSIFITTDGRLLQKNVNNGNPADWERKANRSELYDIGELDGFLALKINYTDLVSNIVTNDNNKPLSASQAIVLTTNLTNAINALKGGASASNDTLKKLEDNAQTFRSRTDNPHNVTKSQVGLGVVENKTSQDIRDEIVDSDIPDNITRDGEADTKISNAINALKGAVSGSWDTLKKQEDNTLAHINSVANPHNVTKAQVGLGVVENKTSATIRSEIVDANIPSTIARDTEVTTAVGNAVTALKGGVPVDGDNLNKLNNKIIAILATLESDDTALDTLQEVVDFIENNKDVLDAVLLEKIAYTDIVDNLNSTDGTTKVLSANQGRVLRLLVEARMQRANNLSDVNSVPTARTNLDVYSTTEVNDALALKENILSNTVIKSRYEANADTNAFTDAEKTKLSNIESNATADQTAIEIETLYESRPNTNKYQDAEKTKLAGIESGATADQTAVEIETLYEGRPDTNKYTSAEKSKLGGIAPLATANQTDAYLLARANHTGTQLSATISDLATSITNNTQVLLNTNHRSLTNNPHAVTKTQIGLSNVTNDAQLKIASNLGDVANVIASRENLGILHLHRYIEYTNTNTTTNLNNNTDYSDRVPIFGSAENTHADFTLNSATQMTANFTGRIRVTFSIWMDASNDYGVNYRMVIGGSLTGPRANGYSGNHGNAGSSSAFLQKEYNITSGQSIQLACQRDGAFTQVDMFVAGSSFIKIERMS